MKILVTGGAGFMGSNFIRHILAKYPSYEVINLDKLTYAGNLDNLKDVSENSRYTFIHGDIADTRAVESAMTKGVEAVINYAAETHVDRSIQEPRAFAITDVLGTLTLLEAARTHAVKKFVQISTDEVFGSISEGTFTEDSPFAPNSPYAASKAGADHLCRAYYKTYDFPVVVTHSCNYYGPYHYPEKLIPLAITNLLEGKKIPVYGSGSQMREWIYTEDHCSAIDAVLHKGLPGQVYNIGTGDERTNIELLTTLLGLMGKTETDLEFVKDRPGHDFRYALNSEKIRKELGWQPSVRLEEGLQKTVAWFEQNRWWWEKIKAGEFKHYYASQYKNLHDTSNA